MRQSGSDNSNLSFPWQFQGADTAAIWEFQRKWVRTKPFNVIKGSGRGWPWRDTSPRAVICLGICSVARQFILPWPLCCCTQRAACVCECCMATPLPSNLIGNKRLWERFCFILFYHGSWHCLAFFWVMSSEGNGSVKNTAVVLLQMWCLFFSHSLQKNHENLLTDFYVSVQAAHEYKFQSRAGRGWSLPPFGACMELGILSNHLPTVLVPNVVDTGLLLLDFYFWCGIILDIVLPITLKLR